MIDFIYISIALVYVVLLIFVFKRDLRSTINRYFILFLTGLLFWHLTLYLYLFVPLDNYLLFIGRLNYATGPIFSLGLLGFFYYFPIENFKLPSWAKTLLWVVTLILVFITQFTDLIDKNETMTDLGPVVTLGDGYYFYLLHVFVLPVITLAIGGIKYFTLKGLNKLKFEYSFWIFVPTMIAFLTSNLILPIFGIIDQFIYSPIFLFPIALSSFYAIAKYRFLDIRLLLARAVAFVIFIFFTSAIYALFLLLVFQKILNIPIDLLSAGTALGIAIFAALSFQPILRWLRKITNKIFYKNFYDREKLIAGLTHIMAQTIDLKKMTTAILEKLTDNMSITKGAFIITEDGKDIEIFCRGYNKKEFTSSEFITFFKTNLVPAKSQLIFDELPEGHTKKNFRESDISIAIPIRVKNETVAILLLGPKLSGEIYSSEDIDFLNIFASESGLAIQNSKSYEHIKKFNILLEKKVEERTHELKISQKHELEKARAVARLKDEFVFIATHELRAPVTAIKGFLQLVSTSTNKFPSDVRENLNFMSAASEHLNQLINDLLEIARSEAGSMQITVQPTDITAIIHSIMEELGGQAEKEQIQMNLKIAPGANMAKVDPSKFKEVTTNLISNAIKYNRPKGKINIGISLHKKKIIMDVRDTGFGIPKKEQTKIFQKFFRASNKKTAEVLGTGLGLFITRMLVEKMGGTIQFSSIEGEGSTFTVTVPKA